MAENLVGSYGWTSKDAPESCTYLTPRIETILRRLGVQRVLDIGAGNGTLCGHLSRMGWQVCGLEYDREGVEIARRGHPGIPFYNYALQDDPQQLLAQESPFDAVISTEVVEHLFAPHLLPIYAAAVLRPGGYLIVSTPYHGYLKNLALSVLGKWDQHHTALWHGGHIKFWSRRTLSQLLADNGFGVIGFSGVGRLPFLWKSMILVARRL
jgi:2-polyprenyl-3-methyl-5-hydroxy-6-metoxy-1,4-benzoquinol methylase